MRSSCKGLEKSGAVIEATEEARGRSCCCCRGTCARKVTSARSERYDKPGKPAEVTPGTIYDDMRRRDFTVNAMACR